MMLSLKATILDCIIILIKNKAPAFADALDVN